MSPSPAFVYYIGAQLGMALFYGYALLEWGVFLCKKLAKNPRRQVFYELCFALPAVIFSFLPLVLFAWVLKHQPFDGVKLVPEMGTGGFLTTALCLLGAGMAGTASAISLFAWFEKRILKAVNSPQEGRH